MRAIMGFFISAAAIILAFGFITPCHGQTINPISIAAGDEHTCALVTNGDVFCWGNNDDYQLGRGETGLCHELSGAHQTDCVQPVPAKITMPAGEKFAKIASGKYHVCGITTNGNLYCWGDNLVGQTGVNQDPVQHPGMVNIPQPTLVSKVYNQSLIDLSANEKWISVSAAGAHTCGITKTSGANPKLYCWGANMSNQLGPNGTFISNAPNESFNYYPVLVVKTNPIGALAAEAVAVGGKGYIVGNSDATSGHTCLVNSDSNKTVYCFGDQTMGQVGTGVNSGQTSEPKPVYVSLGKPLMANLSASGQFQMTAGNFHSCALGHTSADLLPQLYCWGSNEFGQIGQTNPGSTCSYVNSSNTTITTSCSLKPKPIAGFSSIAQLSAGFDFNCALMSDHLYCWGSNNFAQLGTGNSDANAHAVPEEIITNSGKFVSALAISGIAHNCAAIKSSGSSDAIYCWGDNGERQLGTTSSDSIIPLNLHSPDPNKTRLFYHTCDSSATIRDSAIGDSDEVTSIVPLLSGEDYYVTGVIANQPTVRRIRPDGGVVWQKHWAAVPPPTMPAGTIDLIQSAITSDGGIIIAVPLFESGVYYVRQIRVIKLASDGQTVWELDLFNLGPRLDISRPLIIKSSVPNIYFLAASVGEMYFRAPEASGTLVYKIEDLIASRSAVVHRNTEFNHGLKLRWNGLALHATADGGVLVAGSDNYGLRMLKFDSNLGLQWDKISYETGGFFYFSAWAEILLNTALQIAELDDGNLLVMIRPTHHYEQNLSSKAAIFDASGNFLQEIAAPLPLVVWSMKKIGSDQFVAAGMLQQFKGSYPNIVHAGFATFRVQKKASIYQIVTDSTYIWNQPDSHFSAAVSVEKTSNGNGFVIGAMESAYTGYEEELWFGQRAVFYSCNSYWSALP